MTLPFNIGIFVSATQGALNRLDWFELGAGSISKTAAFIVMLMVASWGLIALRKRFIFWIVLSVNCILGYFLILTYSRGGVCCISNCFFLFHNFITYAHFNDKVYCCCYRRHLWSFIF